MVEQDVFESILCLNNSKSVSGNIPTRILKLAANLCVPFLTSCFNSCVDTGIFPDELKLADVNLLEKKKLRGSQNLYPKVPVPSCRFQGQNQGLKHSKTAQKIPKMLQIVQKQVQLKVNGSSDQLKSN